MQKPAKPGSQVGAEKTTCVALQLPSGAGMEPSHERVLSDANVIGMRRAVRNGSSKFRQLEYGLWECKTSSGGVITRQLAGTVYA